MFNDMFSIPFQLHSNVIRDVMFLHESWPWCKGQNALLSVAIDGTAKVQNEDKKRNLLIHTCPLACNSFPALGYLPSVLVEHPLKLQQVFHCGY